MDTYESPENWTNEFLESIVRLTRDLKNASITLSDHEVRFIVDAYYAMQQDRIRSAHQTRMLDANKEPHSIVEWLTNQRSTLEKQVARALDVYSASQPAGQWARSIVGIGPIISSGLIANLYMGTWCNICHGRNEADCTSRQNKKKLKLKPHDWTPEKSCPTAGHFWRYAGQDPTMIWEKGKLRPWNGSLKRLCWIIGESFVKVSGNDRDVYGHLYLKRKEYEFAKNENGDYAEQAASILDKKNFGDDTKAKAIYLTGKLPPGHLHSRAKRYAVKIFLSHLHHVMYELAFKEVPPRPFAIEHLGHAHYFAPPNWPIHAGRE